MNSNNKSNKGMLSQRELKFVLENEVCRISTSHNDMPHVVPVSYIYDRVYPVFVTDYDTRKYRNLKVNKNIALAIDVYDSSGENKAVIIQGKAEFVERGEEFERLYKIFENRFEWVRRNPWEAGEAPFVKVQILKSVSWGL
jgi:nitroimidazol reductase NimA-like FMN-containing flavoprotein (pyridoxamine 5'-phosphate oxidase superfamily)